MRDLYLRLGVSPTASAEEIERAIRGCANQSLKADAQAALGSPERRAEYDEMHQLLGDIGRLRAGLGLTHAPHWHGDAANDFSPPGASSTRQALLTRKLDVALQQYQHRRPRRLWLAVAVSVGLVVAHLLGRLLA
ncbi:hypothetical protein QO259_03395 [Salinicola sp. JS01]|uniref:hypothetical protein n=1 Tax=Salinicola sp. JS01 TaxID=3050071 RepID=UPI00255BA0C1|nr:hypothetical protein [Salinicola sp. JS01]WIX33715.1 hypothetical protein QO259_03395 [Salinicola sp. JS01]